MEVLSPRLEFFNWEGLSVSRICRPIKRAGGISWKTKNANKNVCDFYQGKMQFSRLVSLAPTYDAITRIFPPLFITVFATPSNRWFIRSPPKHVIKSHNNEK